MSTRRSQLLAAWLLFWDLLLTGSAWIGAYYLRFEIGLIPITKSPPTISLCWKNLPLVLLLAAVAYHLAGQYAIHRLRRFREEVIGVVKGTALLSLMVMATVFYTHDPYESRTAMVLFSGMTAAPTLLTRPLARAALRQLRSPGF